MWFPILEHLFPTSRKSFVGASANLGVFFSSILVFVSALQAAPSPDAPPASQSVSYRDALKGLRARLAGDPVREQQLAAILKEAERVRDLPLVERAQSLEELEHPNGKRIGNIDKRAYVVQKVDPKKADIFAVSASDLDNTRMIGRELPLMAAAFVITGDHSYADRIIAQLRETAKWNPLQRPGWMLYTAGNSLPPDGNDGVWLATGQGIGAIWQTLQILPEGTIPPDVMALVRLQLKRESERIKKDWLAKKMWFVKESSATCNQWVVPAAGQALACATLGKDADPEACEMSVTNLLRTLDGFGKDGSASEGAGYTLDWTGPFLYMAAQAMAEAGDNRLASHPFFKKLPTWMAMQFQPGKWIVNISDNYGGARECFTVGACSGMARLVVLSKDPTLAWVFRKVMGVIPYDFYGLLSLTIPDSDLREPPLWDVFDRGQTAVWRSSWDENASGVWVKGASPVDGHDHNDRGHVNFIADGKAVLIEAATPGYDNPLKHEHFDSVMGHNVLQVGDDLFPNKVAAAIAVKKMDGSGGDVTVDAGAGYPAVKSWKRHVVWTKRQVVVTDEVVLKASNNVLFRWHLGSEQSLKIVASDEKNAVASLPAGQVVFTSPPTAMEFLVCDYTPPAREIMETPAAELQVQADQPIACSEEKDLDHAFRFRQPKHQHTTFVVRSTKPVESIQLKTVISVPES